MDRQDDSGSESRLPIGSSEEVESVRGVTLEVMPDGKSIHATSKNKEDGSVKAWTLHKQSQ